MWIKKETKRISGDRIIILLPFWSDEKIKEKVGEYTFDSVKSYIPNTFGYIYYRYSEDLINSNPNLTKKYFNKFISEIHNDLKKLQRGKKKKEFYIFAQSLGGLFAMIISDKIDIKKISLICPGDNLAECFWNGIATQKIKQKMRENGIKKDELKNIWQKISPDFYFKKKSKNTKFYIELSKKDKVIPYKNGENLVKLLLKRKVDLKVKEIKPPHELALMEEGPLFRRSIDFLLS